MNFKKFDLKLFVINFYLLICVIQFIFKKQLKINLFNITLQFFKFYLNYFIWQPL